MQFTNRRSDPVVCQSSENQKKDEAADTDSQHELPGLQVAFVSTGDEVTNVVINDTTEFAGQTIELLYRGSPRWYPVYFVQLQTAVLKRILKLCGFATQSMDVVLL